MPNQDYYREQLKAEFETLFNSLALKDNQKQYLRGRWMDQVLWMEGRASKARDWYYRLRLTTIIGGVIIPILVSLNLPDNQRNLTNTIRYFTIGLGGIVAVSSAVEEFFHYGERWRHYRRSVESLKAQGWQFSQLTGSYANFATHTDAFTAFTLQIEDIIQRDVEVYATQVVNEQLVKKAEQNTGTPDYTTPDPASYSAPAQLPSAGNSSSSDYSVAPDYATSDASTPEPVNFVDSGMSNAAFTNEASVSTGAFTNEPLGFVDDGSSYGAFTNEPLGSTDNGSSNAAFTNEPLGSFDAGSSNAAFTNEPLGSTDHGFSNAAFTNEPLGSTGDEFSTPSNSEAHAGASDSDVTETNPESSTHPA